MITLLINWQSVAIIVLLVQAINVLFWEGHIFETVGDYMEKKHPILWKPIGGCAICMTVWWGSAFQLISGYWNPLELAVAMGIQVVITRWESKD